jgi:hypothetical protein
MARWVLVFALLALGVSCNCGSSVVITGRDAGSGNGAGGNTGGTGPVAGSAGGAGGFAAAGGLATSAGGGGSSGGSPEVCDGVDNDLNGIIDDVDVAKDGVCDCLKVATLGNPGTVGAGDVFQGWLNGKSTNGAESLGQQELTAALLSRFQILIIQNAQEPIVGRSFSAAETEAVRAWVNNGGGLMSLIGYAGPSEIQNVNRLLTPFGVTYGSDQILPKQGGMTIPIRQWAMHPISQGVTRVGVDNGYPVRGGGTLVAWEPNPGQWDVGRAVEVGTGHVFVWGDEWITFNSEWSQPGYQVERFWLNTLKWLTPRNQCQVEIPIN